MGEEWGAGDPTWRCLEVAPEIEQVSIPRPNGFVNVYLIGPEGNRTLVDSAQDAEISRAALLDFLAVRGALDGGPDRGLSQVFLTHGHRDHMGLADEISGLTGATVIVHPNGRGSDPVDLEFLARHGLDSSHEESPWIRPTVHVPPGQLVEVGEADVLDAGRYRFRLLWTPGHHSGHLCAFDESSGILLSGDRILRAPTGVGRYSEAANDPLAEHLGSFERLSELPVQQVLPGHGRSFADARAALEADRRAHLDFVGSVLELLADGEIDAVSLAAKVRLPGWAHPGPGVRVSGVWPLGRALGALRLLELRGWVAADDRADPVRFRRLTSKPFDGRLEL